MKTWQREIARQDEFITSELHHAKYFAHALKVLVPDVREVAEIGVYKGRMTKRFLRIYPDVQYHMIDTWRWMDNGTKIAQRTNPEHWERIYSRILDQFGPRENCHIYKGFSVDVARRFADGSLDACFIDAGHNYDSVVTDIHAWMPKVRKGGLLAGHDYRQRGPHRDVGRAVNDVLGKDNLHIGTDSVWLYFMGE